MNRTATHATMFRLRLGRVVAALAGVGLGAAGLMAATSIPAAATTVSDEATFRAAWTNAAETQIDLTTDVALTCGGGGVAIRNSTTALTLDGHGHTVRQTCAANGVLQQDGTGALTLQNVTITGGSNTAPGYGGGLFSHGPATFTNSAVWNNTSSNGG